MTEIRKNAVVYCRVSTKDQAEGFSLENQRQACCKFAEDHGYKVARVFSNEEGESAKTTNRPALADLIKHVTRGKAKVQAVVVWKLDRLSRQLDDCLNLFSFFAKLNIDVLSVTEPLDQSASGKLMRNVFGSFAQYENDLRAERTTAGMAQAVKEGRWVWRAPVGYRYDKDLQGKNILVADDKAYFIQEAFSLAETGLHKQTEIRRRLAQMGFEIAPQTLNRILRNPVYAGFIEKKEWFPEPVKGLHSPIVSEDLFFRVKQVLSGGKPSFRPRQRNHPDFPLRNFIHCPRCHTRITGSWSTGRNGEPHPYYHCRSGRCGFGSVRRDDLHGEFYSLLEQVQPDPSTVRLFGEICRDLWRSENQAQTQEQQRISRRIGELEEYKRLAADRMIRGSLRDDDYREASDRARSEIESLRADLSHLRASGADIGDCIEYCCHFLTHAADFWQSSGLDMKQRLQDFIFPSGIEYFDGSFGTVETAMVFKVLRVNHQEKSHLVTPTGVEPVLPP